MHEPAVALQHLEQATLDQLIAAYPAEWATLGPRLVEETRRGPEALHALVTQTQRGAQTWSARVAKSQRNPRVIASALPELARARMTTLAVERVLQSAATGVREGPVRLGLFSGTLVQRLLFTKGLNRKPVSRTAFRWLWPLVPDRRLVMPLVQPRGIYCFYSRELIAALAARIAGRPALEIAAGDGTLSGFLSSAGVSIHPTDDHSWKHAVTYPESVENLDASRALARHAPKVVLCSFPPPGNSFEKDVFADRQVETYLVISTRHRFAAGDWSAYGRAQGWTGGLDEALSRLVLPPELDPAVLIFERSYSA